MEETVEKPDKHNKDAEIMLKKTLQNLCPFQSFKGLVIFDSQVNNVHLCWTSCLQIVYE